MSDAGTTSIASGATVSQSLSTTLQAGRVVENAGTWDFTADLSVFTGSAPAPLIHNAGTISKSGGVNNTSINAPVDNDGAVVASSGTLVLQSGAGTNSGSFGGAAATGTVRFNAGTFTLAAASLLGHVLIAGGTVQVADGSTVSVTGSNSMSGGTVGGTGTFSLASGTWAWSGGTMSDAGTTSIAGGVTVSQSLSTTLATDASSRSRVRTTSV